MLPAPVPSARPDGGLAAGTVAVSPAPDGANEEPEPPPSPARGAMIADRTRTFAPAAALLCAPAGTELPQIDITATISPIWALGALGAAAIGSFGAIAAASLIGYSPTRLGQHLDEQRRPDREPLTTELDQRGRQYFVVATIYAAIGWVGGLWALQESVDPESLPWALGGWLVLMLFVAGSLPAAIADTRAERTVLAVLPLLRIGFHLLRFPLVLPLIGLTTLAARVLRLQRTASADPAEVQKQVMAAVADNVTDDALAEDERTWIGNIVTLKDQQVSTVMTPRPDITALPESMSLREAVDAALEHEFSRYPVYRERIDEVIGIFYVKDALRLLQSGPAELDATPLKSLLREPLFVPESTSVSQLLRRVQTGNQHMAIVIDEYGTTVGLATVEDLVEEIVGEIEDEYDPPTSEQSEEQIRVVEAGRVLEIPARAGVQEINRLLGSQLSDDGDWETVAGMVIAACNRIPTVGETVVVDDVEFRVLEADERRVQRLRVTALSPQPAEGAK